jgi:hypothetical protein
VYEFVDRPVAALGSGGRFILWAMRGWIHAASHGNCPPGALAPAFARHMVLPALPHLHTMMAELNRRAKGQIAFLPLAHRRIGEDEAVLLQTCHDSDGTPLRAEKTLELLLEPEAVGPAFTAMIGMLGHLREQGLSDIEIVQARVSGHR